MIQVDLTGASAFWGENTPDFSAVKAAHEALSAGSCRGSDFLGWLKLPQTMESTELSRIVACGKRIRESSQVLVVVGIGGSYLGARAAYELLGRRKDGVELLFAGNGLSADALTDTIERLGNRDFSVNVVSKSGTTLEPALGFRIFRELLEKKYGLEEADRRIYATTDARRGALKSSADLHGWESFTVPDDVGGRYSVLSAVGLLPMAAAGYDVELVIDAAKDAFRALDERSESNPAWQYAAARQRLRSMGRQIELLACYEPSFRMMAEWWKQLFGESEGKEGLGLFPASVEYNADLHSMGQYVQEGPRYLIETVVSFEHAAHSFTVPFDENDTDGLNYTSGHDLNEIAAIACAAVKEAHIAGGVPNIGITAPARNEQGFAELVCFFELSCALSGLVQGVNPFDQPGVEAYKKNMFRMLGDWK
ncbi:MAG: glucose-6-phosphate isomerase [Oscillospiraceae bacterium]|nr:glucose-6-phosphate isomerase [Oscillospiraceae bacterium]